METYDFIRFRDFLRNNNIILFDDQYRIVHYKINHLSALNKNKIIKLNETLLNHFIYAILDNDKNKINWILN